MTTESKTVFDRVKAIIADKLGLDDVEVKPEAKLAEDLNADSLDLVELIMAFEEEFSTDAQKVEVADEDAASIHRVQDVVDYLKAHGVTDE